MVEEVSNTFEKILYADDRSEPAKRALPAVIDLAKKSGAEVLVVHVRETDFVKGAPIEREATEDAIYRAPYGYVATAIINEAAESDSDLIVMGSRGLGDLAGLLVGSTAHKVLHMAKSPVLVVR
jgi:nucleotide-binding universal stress UspA family protein